MRKIVVPYSAAKLLVLSSSYHNAAQIVLGKHQAYEYRDNGSSNFLEC